MPPLFPPEIIENTVECYHARGLTPYFLDSFN